MYTLKYLLLLMGLCLSVSCERHSLKSRDHLVFRYNEHKNISSLDPAFSKDNADIWATHQLFNGLVQLDEQLNVVPCIAKSWHISEDGLQYTFKLRKDVTFHKHHLFGKDSTRKVTAHDFKYSLNRLRDKKLASPGSWVLKKVSHFNSENDSIFIITVKQPFPAFLGLLTMKYCSVVPQEIVKHYGSDFRTNPIGTGPFQFKRWEENNKLVFRKNIHYFENDTSGIPLPYLEAVAITFLPDKQSEFMQFIQGNIDFVSGLDASYKDEILTKTGALNHKYKDEVNIIKGPYLNTEYLGVYLETEVTELQSESLRKAINYGFDREKMIRYLNNGIGIPAIGGIIPKGLPGHNVTSGYTYQPEKAKKLIKDFKKESGITNPSITITTNHNYLNFCEYLQRELQKLDLKVSINVVPTSSLKEGKANGKIDLFRASWVADYPDAENYLSLFYSQNFAPNGPNYTHFKSPLFDKWYQQAYFENYPKNRLRLYAKMDSLVMQNAPIIPLYYDEVVRFTRKGVIGLGINPINLLELKRVRKMVFTSRTY